MTHDKNHAYTLIPGVSIIRGIWECSEGTVKDVEENEMFCVYKGRCTVLIEGEKALHLSPGSIGFFHKGAKTTWIVHEKLLKAFQITKITTQKSKL